MATLNEPRRGELPCAVESLATFVENLASLAVECTSSKFWVRCPHKIAAIVVRTPQPNRAKKSRFLPGYFSDDRGVGFQEKDRYENDIGWSRGCRSGVSVRPLCWVSHWDLPAHVESANRYVLRRADGGPGFALVMALSVLWTPVVQLK